MIFKILNKINLPRIYLYRILRQLYFAQNKPILYTNFWDFNPRKKQWWTDFLINSIQDKEFKNGFKIEFTSVFGPRKFSEINLGLKKVFVTGEDTSFRFKDYNDYLINHAQLSIGFKDLESENYVRFPNWMEYFIDPICANLEKRSIVINEFIEKIENVDFKAFCNREIICTMIASHDDHGNGAGLREQCSSIIEQFEKVNYEGRFKNNSNILHEEFQNELQPYLRCCRFNICLENTNSSGYVTEKLFQAFLSGSIPIYWGSNNEPEPEILTGNRVLFFDPDNIIEFEREFMKLNTDSEYLKCFLSKPVFKSEANEIINQRIQKLKTKLLDLLN